jgi:hypothetical protein
MSRLRRLNRLAEKIHLMDRGLKLPNYDLRVKEGIEQFPEISELENTYGDCINFYNKDKFANFIQENVDFPEEENINWMSLWDSVINNAVNSYFIEKGHRESDIDINKNDALVTIYTNKGKLFFTLQIVGIKKTSYDLVNKTVEKITYHPTDLKIEFAGSKL